MSIFVMMACIALGCEEDRIIPGTGLSVEPFPADARKSAGIKSMKVTGTVEVNWKGADKGSNMGNKPEELLAFLDINAIESTDRKEARGEIVYTVYQTDFSLHRQIRAKVQGVYIDPGDHKAWVVAVVLSDTKGCDGNGGSGHEDSCESSGDDPSSHDGGCSHEETDDGGCTHEDTDDGGCTHEETDNGGCSGSDEGSDTHGGGPGGEDNGNPASGKNCRVGQILALKTHDVGTPGRMDGITWKWFHPAGTIIPSMDNIPEWPHLCKKDIIEGNIVIHTY